MRWGRRGGGKKEGWEGEGRGGGGREMEWGGRGVRGERERGWKGGEVRGGCGEREGRRRKKGEKGRKESESLDYGRIRREEEKEGKKDGQEGER